MTPRTVRPDPRPVVTPCGPDVAVAGGRCTACAYPTPERLERCPECGGPVEPASFGPSATVFACTTVHIGPSDLEPPYRLAYVDFEAGPRLLVHVVDDGDPMPSPGQRVRLVGTTERGDPLVTGVWAR
jgi:uncharacterized OB-fold protein